MTTRTYTGLWSKYRPAILRLMLDAATTPQKYQLSHHEFEALNNGKKGTFTFLLELSNGKPVKGLKESLVAQDLLEILQMSRKASELISDSAYQFSLDKQFVLHIQKL
ncbi:MAG: hypothetical protein QM762_07675 [Chryseolinea sp.]